MNAAKAMEGRRAVLLANHGILAGAQNLLNAFNIVEEVEYCAKIYCLAKNFGEPVVLPDEEMELMAENLKHTVRENREDINVKTYTEKYFSRFIEDFNGNGTWR